MFALIPARRDRSLEHFHHHWRTRHRELALELEEMRRYVQCHRLALPLAGPAEAPFEGIAVTWFDAVEDAMGLVDDPVFTERLGPDEANFMDVDRRRLLFTEDDEVAVAGAIPLDPGALKVTLLLRRSGAEGSFEAWWGGDHRRCLREAFAASERVVASAPILAANQPGVGIDGVVETWWRDADSLNAAWPDAWGSYAESVDGPIELGACSKFASEDLWALGP